MRQSSRLVQDINHVAQTQCYNAYIDSILRSQRYPDLLAKMNATRLAVAEKLDQGLITEAEGASLNANARSEAVSEQERRDAGRTQTQAQVAAARAVQSQATTAAPNPFAVPAANPCPVLVGGQCR